MSLSRAQILFASLVALLLVGSLSGVAYGASKENAPNAHKPAATTEATGKEKAPKAPKATANDTEVTEENDANDDGTPNNVVDDDDNAHPSGKDRSVEEGGSANQGNTPTDPDDDGNGPDRTNGGVDQPGQPGGEDLADQDGNNGCGNDDDFEDDNEGRCGPAPRVSVDEPIDVPTDEPTDVPTDEPTDVSTDVSTDEPVITPAAPTDAPDKPGNPATSAVVAPTGFVPSPVEAAGETPRPLPGPAAIPAADATLAATGLQSSFLLAFAAVGMTAGLALIRSARTASPARRKPSHRG